MKQQHTIPQDIIDAANAKYPVEQKLFVNHPHPHDIHVEERQHYIQGRIDERTAHTPVLRLIQEEVEKLLETLASNHGYKKPNAPDFDSHQTEEYDNNIFMKGCRAGYNAANTVCSAVQPTGSVIEWSDNLNKALNAIDAVGTFVSIMRQRRAVCNPAEWDELDAAIEECKISLDNMRKQTYDSAAKNLPVVCSTGWTDTQIVEIILQGIGKTDSYPDTYEKSWWADKIREWLAEYKLSHAVQVDSRIEQFRKEKDDKTNQI